MIPFCIERHSDAAAIAAPKIANAFKWPGQPPKIAPSCWGICTPSNAWFLEPRRVFVQNDISFGSAVFAQLTVEFPITLQWAATFSPKLLLPLGGWSPRHRRIEPRAACTKSWYRSRKWFRTYPCRLTHRHTQRQTHIQTRSLQYFATAPASEVITNVNANII